MSSATTMKGRFPRIIATDRNALTTGFDTPRTLIRTSYREELKTRAEALYARERRVKSVSTGYFEFVL